MRNTKKLAVFFPGIGYTLDKPLMYFSRRLLGSLGYEIKLIPYVGFPEKKPGDPDYVKKVFHIALDQSEAMLQDVPFHEYEDIVFVGKSVGTIAAAEIASKSPVKDRIRLVLYTPLERTFEYSFGEAIAFTGTADPWVGREDSKIPELCKARGISCFTIPEGNHSLESGNVDQDISALQEVIRLTEKFI